MRLPGLGRLRRFLRRLRGAAANGSAAAPAVPRRRASPGRLTELFDGYGTDKSWYADAYEVILGPRRERIRAVLEVGIGTLLAGANASMAGHSAPHYRPGGSLRAWRDYFPSARILGIDLEPDTQFEDTRITTAICDSTDPGKVRELLAGYDPFDLVIDDGSHRPADQLATLENIFPALAPGGIYIIEDVGDDSPLYRNPELVEPLIGTARYLAVEYSGEGAERWKMIVIESPPAA